MKAEVVPSYTEGYSQLHDHLATQLPVPALSAFDAYGEELGKKMKDILQLKPGDMAPDFTLSNQTGELVSLGDALKKGSVVLVFYRGAWCPYCNLQLAQIQSVLDTITSKKVSLLAISPQTPDASLGMAEKNALKFNVLSDVGNHVARKFTTVYRHADEPTAVLASLGIDFANFYSDDSQELPVPAVFVIGSDGRIRFAATEGGDFRARVEPADILAAL